MSSTRDAKVAKYTWHIAGLSLLILPSGDMELGIADKHKKILDSVQNIQKCPN